MSTSQLNLQSAAFQTFKQQFSGTLLLPGEEGYETGRMVWNGMIDRHPALVAQCEREDDVVTALEYARSLDLPIAVRGGGHNVAGLATCDNGIVIDLSPMNRVEIDTDSSRVSAGGGATLGDVDSATAAAGLVVPAGVVSDTGVAGLTLSGGMGWLRRKYGMTCDNLLAARVVLTDGSIVEASDSENSELLWALRGGGGNFGIVTRFTYQAYAMDPEVSFMAAFHKAEEGKAILRWLRDELPGMDHSFSPLGFFGHIPTAEPFPTEIHGEPYFALLVLNPEPGDTGLAGLEPFRQFGSPMFEIHGNMPYVEVQQFFDEDYPKYDLRYYWKSRFASELSDEMIERLYEAGRSMPSSISTVDIWPMGGAIEQFDSEHAAYSNRESRYVINFEANWEHAEDDTSNLDWVRKSFAGLEPFLDPGTYLNFPGFLEEKDQAEATFDRSFEKLSTLKGSYDPENVFRNNSSIQPKKEGE